MAALLRQQEYLSRRMTFFLILAILACGGMFSGAVLDLGYTGSGLARAGMALFWLSGVVFTFALVRWVWIWTG